MGMVEYDAGLRNSGINARWVSVVCMVPGKSLVFLSGAEQEGDCDLETPVLRLFKALKEGTVKEVVWDDADAYALLPAPFTHALCRCKHLGATPHGFKLCDRDWMPILVSNEWYATEEDMLAEWTCFVDALKRGAVTAFGKEV